MSDLKITWNSYVAGEPGYQPIIFLHGFMGSGRIWLKTMDQLAEAHYCVALDLPGHGSTGADPGELSFDSLAEAIVDLVTSDSMITTSGKKPILTGYSLGGRVALYTALTFPHTFGALVLESSTPGIEARADRDSRLESDRRTAARLAGSDMRDFLIEWYRQPVFAYLPDDLKARIIEKKSSGNPVRLANALVKLSQGAQPSLWNLLAGYRDPVLVVSGEKDVKYVEIGGRMAGLFPRAEQVVIPHAGHIVHLENHKDFMSALKFFLSSHIL